MSQKRSLKEEVKLVAHSLLVPHCNGLPIDKFLKEYLTLETQPLPYKQMGFRDPLEFLKSIPETVSVTTLPSGHTVLRAVAKENSSHIQELVHGQRHDKDQNVKFISNLLRRQPMYKAMQSNGGNSSRSFQQPSKSSQSLLGNYSNGSARIDNQRMMPTINSPVVKEISPPTRASVSIDYERKLVANLHKILGSPQNCRGVELSRISALHEELCIAPILLEAVERGLKPVKFFENHADKFFLWKNADGAYWVCLQEFKDKREEIKSAPVIAPKPTEMVRQAETVTKEGGTAAGAAARDPEDDESLPVAWAATDLRMQQGENLQVRVMNGTRDVKSVASSVVMPSRSKAPFVASDTDSNIHGHQESNIPVTFGLMKPKVKNVVDANTIIVHQEFPPDLGDYEFFFVVVAEVYSPGRFFWFLSDNRTAIESLTDDMVAFYNVNRGYEMSRGEMHLGQIVAAMYTDGLFYRARIIGTHQKEIQVFYIDYGSSGVVNIDRLRHLHIAFTRLPVQAFLGRVFGIQPYPDQSKWSLESGKVFLNMVKGSKTMAAAKMKEEIRILGEMRTIGYVLTLVDTTQEREDLHVADVLVDHGHAAPDEDELKECDPRATDTPQHSSPSPIGPTPQPTSPFPPTDAPPTLPDIIAIQPIQKNNENVSDKTESLSSDQFASSSMPTTDSSSVSSRGSRRRFVKQLSLSKNLKLHIIKDVGELYLAGPDLVVLVPNFEQQISNLKMKIEVKEIDADSHPHILLECVKMGVPWIRDADGDLLTKLKMYPLKVVSPLLYLFRVRDKEITEAIEAHLKNPKDAFFQ